MYSRKDFFKHNMMAVGALATGNVLSGCTSNASNRSANEGSKTIETIAGYSVQELRDRYRDELFGRFIPNLDRYAVDHEYGGVMCNLDVRTGELTDYQKRSWFVGRGMWLYSYLYNHLDPNPDYLEIAEKSRELAMKVEPSGLEFWPRHFNRDATEKSEPGDIYGSLFIAEGLIELAEAAGNSSYREKSKEIIFKCLERYDDPDYEYNISYLRDAPEIIGPRVLGHWMIMLSLTTQMLRYGEDSDLRALNDRCADAIMNSHINPEHRLTNEVINHDLTIPDNEYALFSVIGHGLETVAFVMFEAARRGDEILLNRSRDSFKHHVDVARDRVYGGYFHGIQNIDTYDWSLGKSLWNQEEVMNGTMFLIEHTGDPWACEHFAHTYHYIHDKFIQDDHVFWHSGGDRKMEDPNTGLLEHYHHARQWMYGLLALERILERNGAVSDLFDTV